MLMLFAELTNGLP